MGSETVIFILLAGIAVLVNELLRAKRDKKAAVKARILAETALANEGVYLQAAEKRSSELEREIARLRKLPLTQAKEKADTSVIKARSAADVRRITEEKFGKQPEMENHG